MAVKKKALPKTPDQRNPLTNRAPNTYTQVTNVTLDRPKAVRPRTPTTDPYVAMTERRARSRSEEFKSGREGRMINDVPGYGTVDMDAPGWRVEGEALRTLMGYQGPGAHPNITVGPAINEPHEASRNVVVGRRAEDLSRREYRKAETVLRAYGTSVEDATEHLRSSHDRSVTRAVLAGSKRLGGSGFYGGPSKPYEVMSRTTTAIKAHPAFSGTEEDARAITSATNSLTSPKSKFEQLRKKGDTIYPNAAAANTASMHALGGGDPKDVPKAPHGGIHGNTQKAALAAHRMLLPEENPSHARMQTLFAWQDNPKTSSYVSAHVVPSGPDSYGVSDIHSTRSMAPHLDSRKTVGFTVHTSDGAPLTRQVGGRNVKVVHYYEAEDVGANGLPKSRLGNARLKSYDLSGHNYQLARDDAGDPLRGGASVERMLAEGGPPVHALLDRARRQAAHGLGLTPSVHHAQAQNQLQEIDWRDQQIMRPDMPQSMDNEYPGWRRRMGYPHEDFHVTKPDTWHMGAQFERAG